MKLLNKQSAAIAKTLIFSFGLLLSCNSFAAPKAPQYAIGDTGPAGGIVFYVTALGFHGLEAAPEDQDGGSGAQWGCSETTITGADGTSLGTGAHNTSDILAGCNQPGIAAELADNYSLDGHKDWFLPSNDELDELWAQRGVVGGFASAVYWSSTEDGSDFAGFRDFDTVAATVWASKDAALRVRAVRAF